MKRKLLCRISILRERVMRNYTKKHILDVRRRKKLIPDEYYVEVVPASLPSKRPVIEADESVSQ